MNRNNLFVQQNGQSTTFNKNKFNIQQSFSNNRNIFVPEKSMQNNNLQTNNFNQNQGRGFFSYGNNQNSNKSFSNNNNRVSNNYNNGKFYPNNPGPFQSNNNYSNNYNTTNNVKTNIFVANNGAQNSGIFQGSRFVTPNSSNDNKPKSIFGSCVRGKEAINNEIDMVEFDETNPSATNNNGGIFGQNGMSNQSVPSIFMNTNSGNNVVSNTPFLNSSTMNTPSGSSLNLQSNNNSQNGNFEDRIRRKLNLDKICS